VKEKEKENPKVISKKDKQFTFEKEPKKPKLNVEHEELALHRINKEAKK